MRALFLIALSCLMIFSCSQKSKLEEFDLLLGEWERFSESSLFIERWQTINDSLLSGEAFILEGNDTVFFEKISLVQSGDDIFYQAAVSDQNQGLPVSFRLSQNKNKSFVFENSEHDFPNKITYKLISADSLLVDIEGQMNGEKKTESFPFSRKQQP